MEKERTLERKELFVKPSPKIGKFILEGELQLGWKFTYSDGEVFELPWGLIGLGEGVDDQNNHLQKSILELRQKQKALGNVDFTIDDQR